MSNNTKPILKEEEKKDDLSFIATSGNYDNLKVNPPKRWFNVCVALLVALIGSCIGATIGIIINHFAHK